jgi:hypothetical protein
MDLTKHLQFYHTLPQGFKKAGQSLLKLYFLRSAKECPLSDTIKNGDIGEELDSSATRDKVDFYRQKQTEHLGRTPNKSSKICSKLPPQRKKRHWRPCMRWNEARTGL